MTQPVIIDDDTPEPLPNQVGWLDRTPAITQQGDGRYVATLECRWTECHNGHPSFIVPDVAVGRPMCPQCGWKPAIHYTWVRFSSATLATVEDEVDRVALLRPRDYFTTEGGHDVDLDAVGVGAAGSGGSGNGKGGKQ